MKKPIAAQNHKRRSEEMSNDKTTPVIDNI